MATTIELLESIGSDASLRHACGEHLQQALAGMHASEGLRQAAMSGDSRHLAHELGPRKNLPPQIPTNGGYGGGSDDDDDEDQRDQEHEDKPES